MEAIPKNLIIKIKKIKTVAAPLIVLATIIFLTKTFLEYYEQVQQAISSIPPLKAAASFLFSIGYLYMRALSWRSLAHSLGASVSKVNSLTIWFFSEATRYIPGNIWSFASRAYLAQQKQISPRTSILILPAEIAIVTTTATILSLYAISQTLSKIPTNTLLFSLVISFTTLTLALFLLHKKIKRMFRKIFMTTPVPKHLFTALIFQFLSWSFYTLGTIILIANITQIKDIYLLFSSTMLAWLLGYLSIITPMGLGVRESTFILLTGSQIGIAQAAVVAVLSRTILIIAELANLAFWLYLKKKLKS